MSGIPVLSLIPIVDGAANADQTVARDSNACLQSGARSNSSTTVFRRW